VGARSLAGPYGPAKLHRAVVVTTDPTTLPEMSTWYLISNLPVPDSERAKTAGIRAASLEEIVRLYGLRMWVEQSYKQVKGALGWAEYQVRSDPAIRRHWTLVCCAFGFWCWPASHGTTSARLSDTDTEPVESAEAPNKPIAEKKRSTGNASVRVSRGQSHCGRFEPGWSPG